MKDRHDSLGAEGSSVRGLCCGGTLGWVGAWPGRAKVLGGWLSCGKSRVLGLGWRSKLYFKCFKFIFNTSFVVIIQCRVKVVNVL